jgi:hypothetical protein
MGGIEHAARFSGRALARSPTRQITVPRPRRRQGPPSGHRATGQWRGSTRSLVRGLPSRSSAPGSTSGPRCCSPLGSGHARAAGASRSSPRSPHRRRHRSRGRAAAFGRAYLFATKSSAAQAASRSCSKTPRATRSSSSSPLARDDCTSASPASHSQPAAAGASPWGHANTRPRGYRASFTPSRFRRSVVDDGQPDVGKRVDKARLVVEGWLVDRCEVVGAFAHPGQ